MQTTPVTFRQLLWDFRFVLVALLLVELLAAYVSLNYSQVMQFKYVNSLHNEWFDWFFRIFTNIGDGLFVIIAGLLLVFVRYKYALISLVSFLMSGLVAQIIKKIVKMPRPGNFFKDDPTWYTLPNYHIHSNYSFPSGHTTSIFAFIIVLYYVFPSQQKSPFLFLVACLAGYSRVYLSQHWPGDIYVGAIVGTLVTLLIIYLFERSKLYHSRWLNNKLSI